MKTTKRFLVVLLALCMLFSIATPALSVSAATQSGTCGKNVTWKLDDKGTLTISGSGKMDDYNEYMGVYAPWSDYAEEINTIVIKNGVTSIGDFSLAYCPMVTSVSIPNSVKSIGEGALAGCISLSSVKIPDSVTSIGDMAFLLCMSLTDVDISNSLTGINYGAFIGCIALESVTIPNKVTNIDDYAFSDCVSLTELTIPSSVTRIGYGAFGGCLSVENITFMGNAPKMYEEKYYAEDDWSDSGSFAGVTATAFYPADNATWTKNIFSADYTTDSSADYYGKITWVAFDPADIVPAKPYKIANVVSGVHVYWDDIDGVSKYGLWRSETGKNGTYKWVANPTTYHFTDTKVESGKTYYYKVTAMNTSTGKHSTMSEAIGITYVSTPDITLRVNRAAGIGLRWDKIDGAKDYAIYRKSYYGTDAWVRVATISDPNTLSWDDTSVKNNNGEVYKYTIRALAGSDLKTLSGCRNAGRTMVRLTSRTLNSATKASSTSIKCNWSTTSQATGYEVRFMVGDTVYKTYTVGGKNTSTKTFTGLKAGQTYKIQVRAYKKVDRVGSFYSAWSTAKNVKL